eukprot:jgi/Tetstr1/447205/TSEL_034642.t1
MDITQDTIRRLGLPRVSPEVLKKAFVHRSGSHRENNERLEFLGDSVVDLVMTKYIYQRYFDSSEGVLTKRRNRLVCGQVMAEIGKSLGLDAYMRMGSGSESKRTHPDVMEDTFEALVAVVFLEAGYAEAERWVVGVYEKYVNIAELLSDELEYKDKLVKHFARTGRPGPEFVVTRNDGGGEFRAVAKTGRDNILGIGFGSTRKAAENAAAKSAYKYLAA